MTATLVNLRRARKAKARLGAADQAAENRARYGQTRAERTAQASAEAKAAAHLDGHQLASARGPTEL